MDSSKLKGIIIIVVAALAALYLGIAAATAQKEAIGWVVGVLGVILVLALGKHVWILIPLALSLSGNINALPGAPAGWWGAAIVVSVMYGILFLMRRSETFQFRFTWLDFAMLLQVAAVGQAYMRNPTGLSLFGGAVVGGKTYIIFGFAFVAYTLLSVTRTDIKMFRWIIIGMILVSVGDGLVIMLSQLVPSFASALIPIYSGADFTAAQSGDTYEADAGRLTTGQEFGKTLGLAACSLYPPISFLNPLRIAPFLMMATSLVTLFLAGFRSAVGWLLIVFVTGSLIRKRYLDLAFAGAVGIVGMAFFAGSGLSRQLPFGAQRILSVLPFIDVDDTIRLNAENSTEWRVEMWKLALTSDKYISNKMLGDGFGYSASELEASQDASFGDRRRTAGMNMQDTMLARGSYHGFHVETIRFTGYVGLALALIGMGIWFRYAYRLIGYYKGRPEWGFVIFICMPFLIHPFYYMLVFGSYRNAFPALIVASGLLKLLDNIRVRELAAARIEARLPETERVRERSLPRGQFPRPALNARQG